MGRAPKKKPPKKKPIEGRGEGPPKPLKEDPRINPGQILGKGPGLHLGGGKPSAKKRPILGGGENHLKKPPAPKRKMGSLLLFPWWRGPPLRQKPLEKIPPIFG